MKPKLLTLLGCILASAVIAQTSEEQQRRAARMEKLERRMAIEKRIRETEPRRRDTPVRADNIQDEEIREIQSQMLQLFLDAIVNIGTVVVGCPCEEGSACTDQVWVLVNSQNQTTGLMLSKISGHWKVGPLQSWWTEYDELKTRKRSVGSYSAYSDAETVLIEKFPTCAPITHNAASR